MTRPFRIAILSDIHYACAAEQAEGDDYEYRNIRNPFVRWPARLYRNIVWQRLPLQQNTLLDRFLTEVGPVDYVVANGDYTANVAALGVSNDDAFQSAHECLDKLRQKFGDRLRANFGDHELGKLRLFGSRGRMQLSSWRRATGELGLQPFWQIAIGNYLLIGVTSTLIALPVFRTDAIAEEWPEWERLGEQHLNDIRTAFADVQTQQRILLFCHDPTALPFLWRDETVRAKLPQVEQTIIGHLHSNLYLWKSRWLAGMPVIPFLGRAVKKFSTALNQAHLWKPFHVRLCPALAGIQLLNDGGYLTAELDPEAKSPARFQFHPLPK
jgi:hypothetical protein